MRGGLTVVDDDGKSSRGGAISGVAQSSKNAGFKISTLTFSRLPLMSMKKNLSVR